METKRNSNGDGAALRELAERLLAPPEPAGHPRSVPPRLYPGRLPDGLPDGLPIPDGAAIVGGMAQSLGRGSWTTEVVLDVDAPAEEFREDYRRRLFAAGWREDDERSHERSGFVLSGLPGLFVRASRRSPGLRRPLRGRVPGLPRLFPDFLRLGGEGPRLTVNAADRRGAPTDVRLRVLTGRRGRHPRRDSAWNAIPSLVPRGIHELSGDSASGVLHPPRAARSLPGGDGGGWEPDGAYSYATLETGLDLVALASHYAAQLEGAGWNRVDGGRSGPQAWSTWTFADAEGRPWTGTFSALRPSATSARHLLQVHACRVTGSR